VVLGNCRVTVEETAAEVGINLGLAHAVHDKVEFDKVCLRMVPKHVADCYEAENKLQNIAETPRLTFCQKCKAWLLAGRVLLTIFRVTEGPVWNIVGNEDSG
jgi:hypothetical protein